MRSSTRLVRHTKESGTRVGRIGKAMTDDQDDDELTRRFKAVFNKEPVSKGHTETTWKTQELDEYEIDDEELGKLVEESAAMNRPDVEELVGLSDAAVKEGTTSKTEVNDLLKRAKAATHESTQQDADTNDISEDDIAALLDQLGKGSWTSVGDPLGAPKELLESKEPADLDTLSQNPSIPDDSAEVAAILSQLTDAARLEQKFDESNSESPFPSVSELSLPSVPKDGDATDDNLSTRLAKLKLFPPKTYTGTDRGSINVFVPGISKTVDDETIHWCVICNDDATIECMGCEGDLYCDSCFKEGHNRPDTKTHRWKRYRRKAQAF